MTACDGDTVTFNEPTFLVNCGRDTLPGQLLSGLPSGSVFPLGTTYSVFAYTDTMGNVSDSCIVQVDVLPRPRPPM
ncbi:MAG: HYR domain-containing protein [Bacteroidia bacterium]